MALAREIVRGVAAGIAGGAVMSVSTNLEMRVRGREPSRVPAQTIERALGIDLPGRRAVVAGTIGHIGTSAVLGAGRGMLSAAGIPRRAAAGALAVAAFLPDFVIVPWLGTAPAPWNWSRAELMISSAHHAVYAAGTNATFTWLQRAR